MSGMLIFFFRDETVLDRMYIPIDANRQINWQQRFHVKISSTSQLTSSHFNVKLLLPGTSHFQWRELAEKAFTVCLRGF